MARSQDPFFGEKRSLDIEAEINATVKAVLFELEQLAAMDPRTASEPVEFNARRRRVIRRIWTAMRECVRYGRDTAPVEDAAQEVGR